MPRGVPYELGKVGSEDILDGTVIASELATDGVTSLKFSGLGVSTAKIAAGTVSTANQGFVSTGSPSRYGLGIQTGSFVATTSMVATVFGTPFKATPFVFVSVASSGIVATHPGTVGSFSTGSFTAIGTDTIVYAWCAIGSM